MVSALADEWGEPTSEWTVIREHPPRPLSPGIYYANAQVFEVVHIARGHGKTSGGGAGGDVGVRSQSSFAALLAVRSYLGQFVGGSRIEVESAVMKQLEHAFHLG